MSRRTRLSLLFLRKIHYIVWFLRRHKMAIFWAVFFLNLHPSYSEGQQPIVKHYSHEEGLVAHRIYTMDQDSKGYIWLATDNGVYRFDGQTFKRFSTQDGLPDNDILSMIIGDDDKIWLGCYNRNICYILHDRIITAREDTNLKSFPSHVAFQFKRKGIIYLSYVGHHGQRIINPQGKICRASDPKVPKLIGDKVIRFSWKEISLYDEQDHLVETQSLLPYRLGETKCITLGDSSFLLTDQKTYLHGTVVGGRLHLSNGKKPPCSNYPLLHHRNETFAIDQNKLYKILDSGELDSMSAIYFSDISFINFFQDRSGDYWFHTLGNGVYYMPSISVATLNEKDGLLNTNLTYAAAFDQSIFTISANNQVQEICNGKLTSFQLDLSGKIKGRCITMFVNEDYLLCGSDGGEVFIYNRKTRHGTVEQRFGSIKYFAPYETDCILFNSSKGIGVYNFRTHTNSMLYTSERTISSLWLGGDTILVGKVNVVETLTVRRNTIVHRQSTLFPNTIVVDMQKLQGLIGFATNTKGIFLYKNNQVLHIDVTDGLTDNNCNKLFLESEQELWATTSSGLNHIWISENFDTCVVECITTNHGLSSNDVNNIFKLPNQYGVVGSKGIDLFSPENRKQECLEPETHFSELRVNGQLMDLTKATLSLASNQALQVSLSAIDFRSFGNFVFYYRIAQLTPQWQKVERKDFRLERLPPGKYVLEVRVRNACGKWSKSTSLQLDIQPLWWQKTWIRVIALVGLLSVLGYVVLTLTRKRFKRKLAEEELKKQMLDTELKAIKAQINPHFIFNTLNTIQFFIIEHENEKAELYLNKMSQLIRSTLTFSNETTISIQQEMEYMENYIDLESLRFDEDFNYSIQNNLNASENSIQIPSMVLQPLVENAIRHGLKPKKEGPKNLFIRVSSHEGKILFEIEDNGIGIEKSKELKSKQEQMHPSQGENLSQSKFELFRQKTKRSISFEREEKLVDGRVQGVLVRLIIEK